MTSFQPVSIGGDTAPSGVTIESAVAKVKQQQPSAVNGMSTASESGDTGDNERRVVPPSQDDALAEIQVELFTRKR